MLHPNLRGPENVASGMERDAHAVEVDWFAVVGEANGRARPQARAHDALALARAEVRVASPARVIAVRVGDDRARHGEPGIDVEVAGLAVEAAVGDVEQHRGKLPVRRRRLYS